MGTACPSTNLSGLFSPFYSFFHSCTHSLGYALSSWTHPVYSILPTAWTIFLNCQAYPFMPLLTLHVILLLCSRGKPSHPTWKAPPVAPPVHQMSLPQPCLGHLMLCLGLCVPWSSSLECPPLLGLCLPLQAVAQTSPPARSLF